MNKSKPTSSQVETTKKSIIYWFYHGVLLIALCYLLLFNIFKNDKIVYVDSGKIFNEYKASAEAKKAFQSKAKVWQDNIDTLTNDVKKAMASYNKSLATMSPKEQSLSKQLIDVKQKQLSQYQQSIQENAKEEQDKLTQNVISQINSFLTTYGKSHNYKMILIANQSGTIAYAREGLDISEDVIQELNDQYNSNNK